MRVWVQAFSDLVLTALKERSTLLAARSTYSLSVDPRIAVRAMVVAVVLVAVAVTLASSTRTPTYESSAQVLVDQKPGDRLIPTMTHAIDSRPVAEEAIYLLGLRMEPAELLDNLTVEQVESTSFIRITYEGNYPVEATKIVNTVGEVSSEFISERSAAGSNITATVYDKARVPESPVSPHPLSNGLLTLVIGLVLCAGTVVVRPGVGARVAGTLNEWAIRQGVGEAGLPDGRHGGPSEAERIREQELLEALARRGKLTAVEAALESSLSVEEAKRMLFELAARGHLEVTVEHGRLYYAFWERD